MYLNPVSKHLALEKYPSPAHSKADFPRIRLIPKMRNVWGADASLFLGGGESPPRIHLSNNPNNYKINTKQPVGKQGQSKGYFPLILPGPLG